MRRFFVSSIFALLGVHAFGAEANEGYYMEPAIGGNSIVFVSQGDLWKVGVGGGQAQAITSHVAPAAHPALSPDGKTLAFTGSYEGPHDVYVVPIDGDLPRRLTFEGDMSVVGWTPDGRVMASTTSRSTLPNRQITTIDVKSRHQTLAPLAEASDGSYDTTGKTLFFTRFAFQGSQTKRYKGGTAQNIWKYTDGAAEAVPLTKSYIGTSKSPMWWNRHVYFLSDRDGFMNLWSMDEDGGSLKQHTHYSNWDIQSASLDHGRIAYQLGADIHVLDLGTAADETLHITLASDFDQTREKLVKDPSGFVSYAKLSPDGSKLVLTARGQVFVAPVEKGRFVEASRKPGVRYRSATFAADGKSILALSDQTGETEWWRLPVNGVGSAEQLTKGAKILLTDGVPSPDGKLLAYGDKNQDLWVYDFAAKKATKIVNGKDGSPSDFRWSPDSQWLAFTFPTVSFSRVEIYSVKSGQVVPVTGTRSDAENPAWSPDGKWLYFVSERTFRSAISSPWGSRQPEPFFDKQSKIYQMALVKGLRSPFQEGDELYKAPEAKKDATVKVEIDFDNIQSRLWEVPVPAGNYSDLYAADNRLFVRSSTIGVGSDLATIEIKDKDVSLKTVVDHVGQFELSQSGKKLLISKGGRFYSVDAGESASLDKPVDVSGWTFFIDPREEWRQMFTEAWRLERDYFYDTKMHAVDWPAVLAKYRPLVDRVRDRSELSNVIAQMVGELSALHTFVVGGENRGSVDNVSLASLGGVFSRDEKLGGYRVERIYQGDPDYPSDRAPLSSPGVDIAVGDVILAVNGVDTLTAPDIASLLRNQAGKQVLLHVKSGSDGKVRDCIAVPKSDGEMDDLRYTDWEVSRRQKVDEQSKGNIGYVHLRAMGGDDIAAWERDFYPAFDRSGLIIDVRHNGGGSIDSWIIEKLLRKAWFFWQPRVGNPTWNMQWAFRGHVVVLCDHNTASDGEAFTEGIKRLNLGKVIGTRTWGGEIWLTFSNVLVDGGIASAAEFGVFGPEGQWLIEGHGVDPDILVDDLPHETFLGKDAQLEAAIAYLTKQIKEHPVPMPAAPKYPDKSFHPKGK